MGGRAPHTSLWPAAPPALTATLCPRLLCRHSPPDCGRRVGRQALYKLSTESRSILRGCSTDMCQQAWVPDGVSLRESSQRSVDGARQLSRSNVVAAPPLRKSRSTATSAASAD